MCRARAAAVGGEIGPEDQIMFHFLVVLPLPTTEDATPLRLTASKRDVVRLQPHLMPSNPIDDLGGDRQAGSVASGQWQWVWPSSHPGLSGGGVKNASWQLGYLVRRMSLQEAASKIDRNSAL